MTQYTNTYTITNKAQMSSLVKEICKQLKNDSTVVLTGCLGAGKTFIAKEIISNMTGISQDDVTSPTFSIMNVYQSPKINHVDLYRVVDKNEVYQIGFLEDIGICINIVEWPDLIIDDIIRLSRNVIFIAIDILNDARVVNIKSSYLNLTGCDF